MSRKNITNPETDQRVSGILHLALHCMWIALVWTVCLPKIASWQPVRQHIRQMESSEVAVDAMFYTELEWHPGR